MRVFTGWKLNLFGLESQMKNGDFRLPDWVPEEAWNEWFAWRKQRKYPVTTRVMRHCVKMLEEHRAKGHSPEAVLDNALVMGWRDLWEPKVKQQQQQKSKLDALYGE